VAAGRDAENPPAQVPPSMWTALLGHPLQVLMLPDLGAEARALAAAQVTTLASLSGVDAQLRAEGRAAWRPSSPTAPAPFSPWVQPRSGSRIGAAFRPGRETPDRCLPFAACRLPFGAFRGAFFLPVRPKPGPTRQGTRQVGAWRRADSVGAEDVNDEDQGVGALDPGL
jgi:hypothetical protein